MPCSPEPLRPRRSCVLLLVAIVSIALFLAAAPPEDAPAGEAASPPAEAPAEVEGAEAAPPKPVETFDPRDVRRPAGALRAFVDAVRDRRYGDAVERLDLSRLSESDRARAEELAWRLKIVLDRALWVQYERMSTDPAGDLEDGLPAKLERVPGEGEVELLLTRVEGPDGPEWKVAPSSVARIDALYERYGYGWIGNFLPPVMFEYELLGVALWQWIGLVVVALLATAIAWPLVSLAVRALRPLTARTTTDLDDRLIQIMRPPARLLVALGVFAAGVLFLRLSLPAQRVIEGIESAVVVVALTWFSIRAVDVAAAMTTQYLVRHGRRSAISIVPLGGRAAKVLLLIVAIIAALQDLGLNVTGLIAGLSIGGLAVGLAAQKSIANLFGGVSLALDQPIRVGEFCRFGDGIQGTVEEIGLRSTRVRTLERTLVTVPNAEFSEIQLENFAPRDKRRFYALLGLRYETTPDQLRHLIAALRSLQLSHPMVEQDSAQTRFVGFGASALEVEFVGYITTDQHPEFLAVREDLFLRAMELVEESGTGFAFPSQTLYLGRDQGLDPERVRRAEESVRAWREGRKLPFPDFSESAKQELKGTLEWPPRGSTASDGG